MRLANVRHVRQEHPSGCVIASLAMIASKTYADVVSEYPWAVEGDGGCDMDTVSFDFLYRHGFACQVVYPFQPRPPCPAEVDIEDWRRLCGRQPWPPVPWAPAHLCMVQTSQYHCVVMLVDGTVLDPLDSHPRTLADYSRVLNVRGVFDVAASQDAGGEADQVNRSNDLARDES